MIQQALVFAPGMMLPLLSSRIVGRLALLEGTTSSYKMSDVKPRANEVFTAAYDYYDKAHELMGDLTRFRTLDPLPKPQERRIPISPEPFTNKVLTWARHWAAKWISHLRTMEGRFGPWAKPTFNCPVIALVVLLVLVGRKAAVEQLDLGAHEVGERPPLAPRASPTCVPLCLSICLLGGSLICLHVSLFASLSFC